MTQRRKQLSPPIETPGDDDIFSYAVTPEGCSPEAVVVKIRNTTALETPRAATFFGNDTIFIMILPFRSAVIPAGCWRESQPYCFLFCRRGSG